MWPFNLLGWLFQKPDQTSYLGCSPKVKPVFESVVVIPERPMITVTYKVLVVAADGQVTLELEKDKQTYVPDSDGTVEVTTLARDPEGRTVLADVTEVVYNPVTEEATVYAETDLDLRDGWKIDAIVEAAREDGWAPDYATEYHGCKGPCTKDLPVAEDE